MEILWLGFVKHMRTTDASVVVRSRGGPRAASIYSLSLATDFASHRLPPVIDALLGLVLALDQERLGTSITFCELVFEAGLVASNPRRDIENETPELQVFFGQDEMFDVSAGKAQ